MSGIIPENKKRPRWLWLMGALFLFVVLALMVWNRNLAKESADSLSAAERAWLKAHPVIRLAPDPDFPPIEYFAANGGYKGITADYVALIEKRLGIHIEIVRLRDWGEIISRAKSRQIDVYVATETPQRAEYMLFTKPFLEFPVVIIAREKVKAPLNLDKLQGMKLSVVSEYAAHNFIAYNFPKLNLDLVPDVHTGLRKVSFGLSDAFVENLATATYYIEKEGITNLRIAGESGYFYRMGFCSRKDWPELNRILEKGLAAISADEKKAIYKKWIPLEPRSLFTSREFQAGLLAAVAVILLIVAGVIAWNRALARQVRLRTGELENELSERKRMEEELFHAREDLEKRVEERTAELRSANEMLEREITERKQSDEALHLSRFCIDKAGIGIYQSDENGTIFNVNDHACKSLGYSREELCALSIFDIDPEITRERMLELKEILGERGSVTHHSTHRRRDGTTFPVEITANNLEFQGKSYGISFVKDITGRKRAEEALRESEARLKMAMDLAKLVQWEYDVNSGMFTFDDQFYALYGTTAELEGGTLMSAEDYARKFMPPEESAMVAGGITEVLANSCNQLEHRIIRADGEERFIVVRGEVVRDETGCIVKIRGANQDITERKRMEDELLLSHFCIDKAAIGIIQVSLDDGKILRVNYSACRSLGYSSDELCTMSIFDIEPSFTREQFVDLKRIVDQSGSMTFETVGQRKDGTLFPVEITVNNLEFHGVSTGFSFFRDINERKKAEEALRRAKEEWERTFASVPDLIAILDNQHRILRINEAMGKRLGLKPDECVGFHCYEAIHGLSEPPPFCPHTQTLRDGMEHHAEVHEERLGGDFLVSTTPLDDERGVMIGSVHIAYDITDRKRAEEALRESEARVRRKLESILDPEGDTGELDLADILDTAQIQALMDDLYRVTGIKMSIIDLKGRVLADVGWQDICAKFHRYHPETLKKCIESDTDLTLGVPQGEFRTYRCKNNMWHLVTPIIVGGRHMGNLFLGQFFFAGEKIDYDLFRSQARKYGFPEEEYMAALEAVPRHSEELVNLGKAVFLRLTDMFSKLSYANIKLAHSLAERDRLTATLRQANLVVENSPVVLFRWKGGDEWPVELVSGNIVQFGYTPDDFLSGSITYSAIIHPDDLERVTREVHDFCNEGADQFRLEYRIMTKGGDVHWVNEHTNVERDAAGGVKNFEGIVIDVTERKEAEDSIRASRAKYQAIVDSFDGLIYISSQNYHVEFMNRKLIERTGRDTVGEYCYKVMHDRDAVCPWCLNDRVFRGETVHREMFSPKDNRWYYAVNVPIRHADGTMSKHSMLIDITDRKLFEEELQRQKKLLQELNETLEKRVGEEVAKNREKDIMLIQQNRQAALGEMLDHIAHQWKQPLNSISLIIQDLWESYTYSELTADKINETIEKTMALLEHMAQTIEVFRDFYRPDKKKTVFCINDSIDKVLAIVSPALKYQSIAVELDLDPGLLATGYPKEYSQVLLNILSNARDALRERKTENPRVKIRAYAEGDKAVVTITDNAGGIPESIIHRIFDLYITTKEASGGTGIGLHMSKNIIEKNMGGTLTAENTVCGAQFRIAVNLSENAGM
jgi:PAS domain S-box-containing protein